MTYDEFLQIVKCDSDDITFKTYSDIIEPMYMSTDLDKRTFCSLLNIKNIIEMTENVSKYAKNIIALYKGITDYEKHECYLDNANDIREAIEKFGEIKGGEGRLTSHRDFINGKFEVSYHSGNRLARVEVYKINKNKIVIDDIYTY